MGPDDFLRMYYAWRMAEKHRRRESDRLVYVNRMLVQLVNNALSRSKIKDPSRIIKTAFDSTSGGKERQIYLKQRAKEMFERAKKRGSIK